MEPERFLRSEALVFVGLSDCHKGAINRTESACAGVVQSVSASQIIVYMSGGPRNEQ